MFEISGMLGDYVFVWHIFFKQPNKLCLAMFEIGN